MNMFSPSLNVASWRTESPWKPFNINISKYRDKMFLAMGRSAAHRGRRPCALVLKSQEKQDHRVGLGAGGKSGQSDLKVPATGRLHARPRPQ